MKSLQQSTNETIERLWLLQICAEILDEKLRTQGITLPKDKLKEAAQRILDEKSDLIELDIGDAGSSPIQIQLTQDDIRKAGEKMERISASMPGFLREMTERGTEVMFESMKRRWPAESRTQKRDIARFRRNLNARWGGGLRATQDALYSFTRIRE